MRHDVDVLIIGAGMSGLGFAIQLARKYNTRNFEIIEKSNQIGGTWWVNSYPGCGCDVPSHFYSYSFALNPDWSRKFALQSEIHEYFESVASKYAIQDHVRLGSIVETARWQEATGTWAVTIRDLNSGAVTIRTCKILVSAVGALSVPKKCEIPGSDGFQGSLFHTAEWDHSFDWKGKDVVIIGNGCSATQIIPVISEGSQAVRKVTQFSRQPHWLAERPNPEYSSFFKWTMRWVPFVMRAYRAALYWGQESEFVAFDINTGAETRKEWEGSAARYIRETAPEKYRDFLIPKTEVACKRRVNDTDYLLSLHRDNVELVYRDSIEEIVEDGVRTKSGRRVRADAIVLAHGFQTHKFLSPMGIYGEGGISINEHWDKVSEGVSSAYLGTCVAGFPNFFIMMGPNTLSGHLSVIYTSECQINYTLRVLKPVMKALQSSRSWMPTIRSSPDIVAVSAGAEERDIAEVQDKAKKLVWASGCTSWFIEKKTKRNTAMYPDWQYRFWLRSVFIAWDDLVFRTSSEAAEMQRRNRPGAGTAVTLATAGSVVSGGLYWWLRHPNGLARWM